MRAIARAGLLTIAVTASCTKPAVTWELPASAPADTFGGISVSTDGRVAYTGRQMPQRLPEDSARCDGSVAAVRDGGVWYVTWFSRRPNASVLVRASRSLDEAGRW